MSVRVFDDPSTLPDLDSYRLLFDGDICLTVLDPDIMTPCSE